MRSLLTLCLVPTFLLLPACGSLPTADQLQAWETTFDKGLAAAASVAQDAQNGVVVVKAVVSDLKASVVAAESRASSKIDDALAKAAAVGADTSSAGGFTTWAIKNPGQSSGLGGATIGLIYVGILLGRNKLQKALAQSQTQDQLAKAQAAAADAVPVQAALNALVDTIDASPPTVEKAALMASIAQHPQMGPDAMVAVTEARAR